MGAIPDPNLRLAEGQCNTFILYSEASHPSCSEHDQRASFRNGPSGGAGHPVC